jgi:hypothetical protein
MNPFMLAQTFLEYGWKVVVVDLSGVDKTLLDIEHVIGCHVLNGKCFDGYLEGL